MCARSCRRTLPSPAPSGPVGLLACPLKVVTPWAPAAITLPCAGLSRAEPIKKIADAGLLIGFLDRKDSYHHWAAEIFERESPPFHTAEPILAEVAAVMGTPDEVLRMLQLGDLVISLDLQAEAAAVRDRKST